MAIALKTIGVIVKDMEKTLQFYRELGLTIPQTLGEPNVDVELQNGIVLGFLTEQMAMQADPNFISPTGQSLNLQFECASASEVDATFAKLTGAGYASYAQPWDAFWGQRFARVTDPDGRTINIYAQL